MNAKVQRQKAEAMLARIAEYMKSWDECDPDFIEEDAGDLADFLRPAHDHANGDTLSGGPGGRTSTWPYKSGFRFVGRP